jgi:hypothetical protein
MFQHRPSSRTGVFVRPPDRSATSRRCDRSDTPGAGGRPRRVTAASLRRCTRAFLDFGGVQMDSALSASTSVRRGTSVLSSREPCLPSTVDSTVMSRSWAAVLAAPFRPKFAHSVSGVALRLP